MTAPPSLNILSLNCWGLKYVSKHRQARLHEIAVRISRSNYDLVALQEFWVHDDYVSLRRTTKNVLPYGKFYHSGVLGGGLVILSKYPIVESSMVKYTLNGRPTAFWRGDWYVGKGVACATIQLPTGEIVEVFNTHLHAPYEPHPHDSYLCHRTAQAWEIAKLLRKSVERGVIAIALGDFNMVPNSLAHSIVSGYGLVTDSWMAFHPDTPLENLEKNRTAEYNLKTLGATCDSVLNTWRWNHGHKVGGGREAVPPPNTLDPDAKRLDYIFYSDELATVTDVRVGFVEPMTLPSGEIVSCSDHFSVEITLSLTPSPPRVEASLAKIPSLVEIDESGPDLLPTSQVLANALTNSHAPSIKRFAYRGKPLPVPLLDEILKLTDLYFAREVQQSRWRIGHFFASVAALVGMHVAVWFWNVPGGAFMWVFLSWAVATTGVIDGLVGFLFMWSEMSALREFREEIEIYKALVTGGEGRGLVE